MLSCLCGDAYIQENVLLVGKSSPCDGSGFPLSLSPSFTSYEAGTSPDWDGDTKVCLFKYCQKRHCFFVGCPAVLALRAMKRQIQLPSLPWICLVPRLVYPTLILNM